MVSADLLLKVVLDGLTIGMVYVLAAAGLSIVFGVMDVLNIAHGELFALGAYLTYAFFTTGGDWTWLFWVALVAVPIAVGLIGMLLERLTLRPLYGRGHLDQALVTFGALLVIHDVRWLVWGRDSKFVPAPPGLDVAVGAFGVSYSAFSFFVIAVGGVLVAGTWAVLNYTDFGMIVRAGAQDREMVGNLGIDINQYYTLIFGFGMALAGVGGVVLSAYQNVSLGMGNAVLIPAFVIVVIGGLGSFKGAVVGGILVGVLQSFMAVFVPILSGLEIFLIMIVILLLRPQGLFGNPYWDAVEGGTMEFLAGVRGGVTSRRTRVRLGLGLVAGLALLPVFAGSVISPFYVTLAQDLLIWAILAVSLDLIMGYLGLISLGHAMFYGLGGYTAMLAFIHLTESVFLALPLAVLVGALVAVPVGYLSIQVRGPYFILITLGFAELFYQGVFKFAFTGGSDGLFGVDPVLGLAGIALPTENLYLGAGPFLVGGDEFVYYLVLLCAVGAYLFTRRLINAPFGSVLRSIRESERRAAFVGYDVQRFKLQAFVISGAIGSLAGGLFAVANGFAAPALFHWLVSGELILMVVFGGLGTLHGAMLGAGLFVAFEEGLSTFLQAWRLLMGLMFILFVIFVPKGLVSLPAALMAYRERLGGSADEAREPEVND